MEPERERLLAGVGPAFSRLRRRTARPGRPATQRRKDLTRALALNVVAESDDSVTVGTLAELLGIDPSVGSRMANDCITAGLLERALNQDDGRRAVLRLTEQGRLLLEQVAREQRRTFEEITEDWPDRDRLALARLVIRYADAAAAWQARQQR